MAGVTRAEALAELAKRGIKPNMSRNLSTTEQKAVGEAQTSARYALDVLPDVNRFEQANALTPTGGANRWNDMVQGVFDPKFSTMKEITARVAPQQRVAGSGTTSDRDLSLFLQASPTVSNRPEQNSEILDRGRAEAVRRQQYADFLDKYAAENGTLNGAEAAFRQYEGLGTRQTPYKPDEAGDRSQLPRGSYYTDPQGNLRRNDNGSRGNPIVGRGTASQGGGNKPPRPQPGEVKGEYRFKGGDPANPNSWAKL